MTPPRRLTPDPALARAGQRILSRAERALLASLRAAEQQALAAVLSVPARSRTALLLAIQQAAVRLRADVELAVLSGRGDVANAALARFAVELSVAGVPVRAPTAAGPSDVDRLRAASAADSFAAAWRAALTLAAVRSTPSSAASKGQGYRLATLAATETSEAYSATHAGAGAALREQYPRAAWLALLVRVWDSTRDRKRCPVCASMHGRWALIGRPFPGDREPGAVHPRCRCSPSLLALKPAVLLPGSVAAGAALAA